MKKEVTITKVKVTATRLFTIEGECGDCEELATNKEARELAKQTVDLDLTELGYLVIDGETQLEYTIPRNERVITEIRETNNG